MQFIVHFINISIFMLIHAFPISIIKLQPDVDPMLWISNSNAVTISEQVTSTLSI